MKVGVCIVTYNRPDYLEKCIASLSDYYKLVVINNGVASEKVHSIVKRHSCYLIDGKGSNSPHGQNLGLSFLAAMGCEAVLKSDDDIQYSKNYIQKLLVILKKHPNKVAAVCGTCWSDLHPGFILKCASGWRTEKGEGVAGESIVMFRMRNPVTLSMNHLHGSFLYNVKDAQELAKKTRHVRGGAFGEYFSQIAFREESEFSFCLKAIQKKELVYNPGVSCYHYFAPGGIRDFDQGRLMVEDERKVEEKLGKLSLKIILDPAECGVFEW
jgi:glycosyltransferase involved in cell wall biosynthesis